MMKMGISSNMVDLILEMSDALNSGHMKSQEPRLACYPVAVDFGKYDLRSDSHFR
jgi:hypothetical protein